MGQEIVSALTQAHWLGSSNGTVSLGDPPIVFKQGARTFQPGLRFGLRPDKFVEIPFESQRRLDGERMCGAAALSMVLHSLGVPCTQEELWSEIACPDGQGQQAARTFHLASAALRRGIPALVVQVRDGWFDLKQLVKSVPGLILNHRIEPGSAQGHFTVLLDINDQSALLHDPLFGPRRVITRSALEKLWNPAPQFCEEEEIAGRVVVGIGPRMNHRKRCKMCDLPFPADAICGSCAQQFPLQPADVLGCMRGGCGNCRWQVLFCPFCDAAFGPLS